ncbi:hypothetical protein [Streptomyces kebangsaanensis]|uniref:hypothetical protein n=1 Tax=Streptomyces kebangsaanensis TaxID=864058 RepID=UPI00093A9F2F|nr:hypothetical protein [Streptomyces kebangsaanensis]
MRLVSERYPQLWVPRFKVRFRDGVAEVDDAVAAGLLAAGIDGVRAADTEEPEAGTQEQKPEKEQEPPDSSKDQDQEPEAEEDQEEEPPHPPPAPDGPAPPAPERPSQAAPKAAWVAYADHQDPADHSQMTKAQLIETYGG